MPRVFVSHSTRDRDFVEREIIQLLAEHGIESWYSKESIASSVHWERAILEGLKTSDSFLLVMSPRSASSPWVKMEVDWAFRNRTKKIVPVLMEKCNSDDFHLGLASVQHVDFSKDSELGRLRSWENVDRLIRAVSEVPGMAASEPAAMFRRIAAEAGSNREKAARELMELLTAFPEYQPARLYFAEWQYNEENYALALREYEQAFKLGKAHARHYGKASLAASKLKKNQTALQILQLAEQTLPAAKFTGAMLFNMGCYSARLGDNNGAMAYLRRAMASGFTKAKSYHEDPDLDPLRSRGDFQRLLTNELTVHFRCRTCNKPLRAITNSVDQKARCPGCGTAIFVPRA